jgi:putative oxidoreductase
MDPIGRIDKSEEIADAAVWLSSSKSSFVTGHSLLVDGGFTAQWCENLRQSWIRLSNNKELIEDGRSGKGMAQALTEGRRSGSSSTGKTVNVVLWILQIGAAGMFLMAGFFKLSGDPRMVGLFDTIGLGQWFRYLTGSLEVLGAVLLLIPRLSGLGALLLAGTMLGAAATHLFVVGGSPLPAIILLIVTGVIAWGRRQRTMNLLARQR